MVDLLHLLLFFGGLFGWTLFSYTLYKLFQNRSKELKMINEIKEELKIVKEELQNIK